MFGTILYGLPSLGLIDLPAGARQVSPLVPGSVDMAGLDVESEDEAIILAPPGTLERDYVLAQTLRVLKSGAPMTVFAPKDKGGTRLAKALKKFGCEVSEDARRHHRFCYVTRPINPINIDAAIAAGNPRLVTSLGLWSQPGVFSWDRIDSGTALLLDTLPEFVGKGADLGGGIGVLGHKVLSSPAVTHLALIEIDRRAVEVARRNLDDPRVQVIWEDVRRVGDTFSGLDFVVMNPPFHDGGREDRALGVGFIALAAAILRRGGVCWLTANRHLPYEAPLAESFSQVTLKAERGGYKIFEARK